MATSEGKSFWASGNINPSSFVKLGTADDFFAAQATSNADVIYGVAQAGAFDPPGISGSTAYAANAPPPLEEILVYHQGDVCGLVAGTAGYSAGSLLTSDVNGYGVAATSGNYYGARALETAKAGCIGRVEVQVGKI